LQAIDNIVINNEFVENISMHQDLFKDVWITAGIFSKHYLLERLPQAGPTAWPKRALIS
jgi:hypothetical protein